MIKQTTDYTIFKKHPSNVSLLEVNVTKIMKSIQSKNLLQYRPILVDSEMRVIDGQHRLEAAKRLGIPIFYDQQESLKSEDMRLLNENMRTWSRQDYLEHYCSEGKDDYIKLKRFSEKHKLNLPNSFVALGLNSSHIGANNSYYTKNPVNLFKSGLFKFPDAEQVEFAEEILEKTARVIEYIYPKLPKPNGYVHGPGIRRSLYLFLAAKSVDFDVFMAKLSYKLDIIHPQTRLGDTIKMFQTIYNWKNKNPVDLNDIA